MTITAATSKAATPVLVRVATFVLATIMLLLPALWNRFPLLQYDTGGYIARWYEGTLEISRSTVYGLFLNGLTWPDFWPVVVVQAVLTVWVMALVLRVHGLSARVLLVTVAALTVFTTLPWVVDQLITDIFFGLAVLALYLVLLRAEMLARWERVALWLLIAFSASSHSATLAVLLALLCAAVLAVPFGRIPWTRVALGFGALVLGAAMLVAANFVIAGRLAWTPGGVAIPFGRMLQVGIVARYLDDHCPDPRLRLCDYRADLPRDADVFFWSGKSAFDRLGRFAGLNDEMHTIVVESLIDYPWLQVKAAVAGTAEQLVSVATGWGVNNDVWHTYGVIANNLPAIEPVMSAARQQKRELSFTAINRVHVPIAWAAMLLLAATLARALVRRRFTDLDWLMLTIALALLANAVVCGALSNPHDRYGARAVWLAPFALLLMPWLRKPPGAPR